MRDCGIAGPGQTDTIKFMRILLISVALLGGLIAGLAGAGVPATPKPPKPDTAAVMGMRAFVTRCIPGIAQAREIVTTGLVAADPATEAAVLGPHKGAVWTSHEAEIILIAFTETPVCRIVVPGVDPAVMTDLILGVFRDEDGLFRNKRIRFEDLGGMVAVYRSTDPNQSLVLRVTTGIGETGLGFALLSAERAL